MYLGTVLIRAQSGIFRTLAASDPMTYSCTSLSATVAISVRAKVFNHAKKMYDLKMSMSRAPRIDEDCNVSIYINSSGKKGGFWASRVEIEL